MSVIMKLLLIICILFILYLIVIMPRMIHKPDKTPFLGVLYAHRGLHDNTASAPENSMAAFSKAVESGYGIELDVRLSRDGIPIVFHDATLERICGVRGKVSDYTCKELKQFYLLSTEERIPTLDEFLKLVNGRVPLIVELKADWVDIAVCPAADSILRNYQGVYCIESFNPLALLWYRRNHCSVMRGQLSDAFIKGKIMEGFLYLVLQNLLLNIITKPDFVAYNHKYANVLSRTLCRKLYRNLSVAWTIRSQQELEEASKKFDLFIFDSFIPKKENRS